MLLKRFGPRFFGSQTVDSHPDCVNFSPRSSAPLEVSTQLRPASALRREGGNRLFDGYRASQKSFATGNKS